MQHAKIPWAQSTAFALKAFRAMVSRATMSTNAKIIITTAVSIHTATIHLVPTSAPVFMVLKGMGKNVKT